MQIERDFLFFNLSLPVVVAVFFNYGVVSHLVRNVCLFLSILDAPLPPPPPEEEEGEEEEEEEEGGWRHRAASAGSGNAVIPLS